MPLLRRRHVGALVLAVVLLVSVGVALAARQHKGWVYATGMGNRVGVSFFVSKNGKKVFKLFAGDALKCPSNLGGAGGFPGQQKAASARISPSGSFKVKIPLFAPQTHKRAGTDTVTGTFLKHNRAKGKVKTHFNKNNGVCKATTLRYTAQGFKATGG